MWKRQILAILEEIENDALLQKLRRDLRLPAVTAFLTCVESVLDRLLTIIPPLSAAEAARALRELRTLCVGPAISAHAEYLERAIEVADDAAGADQVIV